MPTERVELGPAHVQRALEAAGEGVYRSSDPLVFADSSRNGLAIRGVARRATWVVRWKRGGKERTVTLGEVLPSKSREKGIRSTALARALAREVRHRLDAGLEVTDAWLAARRLGQGADEAESTASRKADADAGRWRWEDLVEWPAAGFVDTGIGCWTRLEGCYAETEVQPRVQA